MNVAVGDWVRFYRNGVLVIGVVEYIDKKLTATDLCTSEGRVDEDYVLEVRRKND